MVCACNAGRGEDFTREFAKPSLHPVPDDGVANFLGDRVADADLRVRVLPVADKQNEAAEGRPFAVIRVQKILPLVQGDQAESFLRPRARRARITARPPTVAMRARKP